MKLRLTFLLCVTAFISCSGMRELSPEERALREQKLRELLKSGNDALRQGEAGIEHAQAAYWIARELHPDDPRVIDGLGCVAWRKGNAKLAEFYFRRAIELAPDYDRPVAHLALIAESRGHKHAAKELLLRAVRMNPLNFRHRNNFAAVLLRTHHGGPELGEAHRELMKAYELAGPEDPVVDINLTELKRRIGW